MPITSWRFARTTQSVPPNSATRKEKASAGPWIWSTGTAGAKSGPPMKAMIGLAPATSPSAIQAPRMTQTSNTRWKPYESRARSVSAARESTGNAVPTTSDGIATKDSTTRNETLK